VGGGGNHLKPASDSDCVICFRYEFEIRSERTVQVETAPIELCLGGSAHKQQQDDSHAGPYENAMINPANIAEINTIKK
jgi:hypothetical protein